MAILFTVASQKHDDRKHKLKRVRPCAKTARLNVFWKSYRHPNNPFPDAPDSECDPPSGSPSQRDRT